MDLRFYVGTGYGYSIEGHKESWMIAEEDAYSDVDEDLEEWLKENMPDRYYFESDSIPDEWVDITLYVVFENKEDAMAFKLRWI